MFNITKFAIDRILIPILPTPEIAKISKDANIKNRYNQDPHLIQDTNGKVTNSQLDTTNESQEVSPFPACDHKAQLTDAHKGITNTRQK